MNQQRPAKGTHKGVIPNQKMKQPRPYRGRPARGYDATTGTWRATRPPGVPFTATKESP